MLTKEQVISAINQLPCKFSIDEVIDELILLEKDRKGISSVRD
jgi:hypothetical protein